MLSNISLLTITYLSLVRLTNPGFSLVIRSQNSLQFFRTSVALYTSHILPPPIMLYYNCISQNVHNVNNVHYSFVINIIFRLA